MSAVVIDTYGKIYQVNAIVPKNLESQSQARVFAERKQLMSIPKTLEDRLRSGKVIPFIGAGVSRAVKDKETGKRLFPSWKELLERAAARLDEEQKAKAANLVRALLESDEPEYLEAAERARKALGPIWFDFLKGQLDHPRERADDESLKLAEAIWKLGSPLLITTNYDRVLHWSRPQRDDLSIWDIEAPVEQRSALRDGVKRSTVWHLHGSIDDAVNIILTREGYNHLYPDAGNVEQKYRTALATLHSLMSTHTFLFIGFSLDDYYLGGQLREIAEIFQNTSDLQYVLAHTADRDRIRSLKLPVEPLTFEDFGEPLLNLLAELSDIAAQQSGKTKEQGPDASRVASYDPHNPVFYVPFRAKGDQVVGREETLLLVREQLTSGRRTAIGQTAAFGGLGGLGKTQLAVEYAYRYRDEYPNGVIWLTADQDIDAQLTDLAEKARWVARESEHKYKLEIAQHRLQTYSDCLIIFDNLESIDAIEKYLPEPQANPHILVTSRTEQPGFRRVPLNLLDSQLSLKLLLQEAGRTQEQLDDAEENAAREVANALGGLPLALELAGAYVSYRGIGWQQYNDLLKQSVKAALPGKFLEGSFTKHEKDLYSTLKINEAIFSGEPQLEDILNLLTWSGSAPMGLSLMCTLLEVKNPTELTSALGLATALHLLQKSPEADSYSIHRLVSEVRREDIPLIGHEDWIDEICRSLGDWFQGRKENFEDLPSFEAEIDHLQTWQQHSLVHAQEQASRLTWLQAYPPYHRGRYQEAKEWVEKASRFFEQAQVNNPELESHLLNDLGSCTYVLGDYKRALEYQEKALTIRLELFGERHPDTAMSFNNVGNTYGDLGDNKRASEYHEKALTIRLELFGERHPDTAMSFNNIGNTYGEVGDNKRALQYVEKALKLRRDLLGDQHPDTVLSINNMSVALSSLGRLLEARQLVDRTLHNLPTDHLHYDMLSQTREKIVARMPGFRSQPTGKHKQKKKKRR
jgi:tetratricopeptide (TPR) repeat protein